MTEKNDELKDIQAILEFLQEIHLDVKKISPDLKKLEELEKEAQVTKEDIITINLESQAKILDNLIERYEFFQNDVDINGIRLKKICKSFLKKAEKVGLKDLVKEKKKDKKWKFSW